MDPALLLLSASDEEEKYGVRRMRKLLRDKNSDPLLLSDTIFKEQFRLSKKAFNFVLTQLEFNGHMSTRVPPKLQLAATLALLASGSAQYVVENYNLMGMSQSTVDKCATNVVKEIEDKLCAKFIKFNPEQSSECMEFFMREYNIHGVIGCVDCTHFGVKPSVNEFMFWNRRKFFSLNSLITCDHEYKIRSINSRYGGESCDSFVWQLSDIRSCLEELYRSNTLKNVWLLADYWFPVEPWCIRPYRKPEEGSMEAKFNDVHSNARCVMKKTIDILKGRWKILSNDEKSPYSPETMLHFGNACAALHNICILYKVPMYTSLTAPESVQQGPDIGNETNLRKIGLKIRDHIKLSLRDKKKY